MYRRSTSLSSEKNHPELSFSWSAAANNIYVFLLSDHFMNRCRAATKKYFLLLIHLPIAFLSDWLRAENNENNENVAVIFQKRVTFLNGLFCLTNSPKSVTFLSYDKEKTVVGEAGTSKGWLINSFSLKQLYRTNAKLI